MAMDFEHIRAVMVFGPILALLAVGMWLTVRSGVVGVNGDHHGGMRQMASNFTHTLALLIGCVIVLAVMQEVIGFRISLSR